MDLHKKFKSDCFNERFLISVGINIDATYIEQYMRPIQQLNQMKRVADPVVHLV